MDKRRQTLIADYWQTQNNHPYDQTSYFDYYGDERDNTEFKEDSDSESESESEDCSDLEIMHDSSWGDIKYPTDKYGKFSWKPIYIEDEIMRQRLGLQFINAIYSKDIKLINQLLEKNIDIEICGPNGNNALMLAVIYKCRPLIKFLLRRGVEVDFTNDEGANALHMCCLNGDVRLLLNLFAFGADVNKQIRITGDTPLHVASYMGHFKIVKKLVRKHADVLILNNQGYTPLNSAKEGKRAYEANEKSLENSEHDLIIEYLNCKMAKQRKKLFKSRKSQKSRYCYNNSRRLTYYDSGTNTLANSGQRTYRGSSRRDKYEEDIKDVVFGDWPGFERDSNHNSFDYSGDNSGDNSDEFGFGLENIFGDDENETSWDENTNSYYTGGYVSPNEQDMIEMDDLHSKISFIDDEEDLLLSKDSKTDDYFSNIHTDAFWDNGHTPDGMISNTEKQLYFCKKCSQEKLDIHTGVCENCRHIFSLYGTCPWCESGIITGHGKCNECECKLYEDPKTNMDFDNVIFEDKESDQKKTTI